jgi:hypothetical protein
MLLIMMSICKVLFLLSALILVFTQCKKEEPEPEPLIPDENLRNAMYGRAVVESEDVNYPIPQRQIDLHNGNLYQNR